MSKLGEGEVYHVFNKSIANYVIFNTDIEYKRMLYALRYHQLEEPSIRLNQLITQEGKAGQGIEDYLATAQQKGSIDIIAYCIMPTHFHLALRQNEEKSLSVFMSNVLNSYARYFNIKHNRKGPLWEGRSKKVLVTSDEQLLHLTRYIHLNPVTAYLADDPADWPASSYREYVSVVNDSAKICHYDSMINIKPSEYKEFVRERVSDQRDLARIKRLILE